jgi:hypothetical protein
MIIDELFESPQQCPECGGISFSDLILAEKKDACYHKVKASAKVWPSAYASGRLVQCRKKGAANYGKSKNESVAEGEVIPFKQPQPQTAVSWQKLPKDVLTLANDWFWADYEGGGFDATMDPKGLGSGFANQQKYLGAQLQQRGWAIDIDDEFENVVLKNKQGQTILLPIEDAQTFSGWATGTNSVTEQGVAEGSDEIRTAGRGAIRIPGDMSAPHWREPTWSFQEIAQKLGIPVSALNLLAFNRIGGFPEALPGLAARYGSKKYYKQSEIKRWVNANNVREKLKQGMLEGALDDSNFGKSAASMTPTPQAAQQARDIVQQRADDNVISQAEIAGAVPITREGEQQKGADYRDPKEVDYDGEYDAMVARVKRLAGLGPMKTVYDPNKRVYRNMPTAQQLKK